MFTKSFQPVDRLVTPARRRMSARLAICVVFVATAVSAFAAAPDKLTPADRQAIETTIRRQIDAFANDDAARAFAFAAPEIQRQMGTAERFMGMVREHYAPVYRAGGLVFARLATIDGEWIQAVQLTDEDGRVWRAFFTMRRQPDRGWKVGGCQLVETSALST